jgi:hypothetical protein
MVGNVESVEATPTTCAAWIEGALISQWTTDVPPSLPPRMSLRPGTIEIVGNLPCGS